MLTNRPANSGLINAPILPHKFIHPDTVPEKLRPKSVAAAQLIPIEILRYHQDLVITRRWNTAFVRTAESNCKHNKSCDCNYNSSDQFQSADLIHGAEIAPADKIRVTLITKVMN